MAISLNDIAKTKHAKPPRIVIHGSEKVGKSTFFAQADDVVFIQTEDGLAGIDAHAFPLAEELDQVFEAIYSLQEGDHDFRMVVIDSGDWLERLIHDKVCQDHGVKSIELAAGGYGKGYAEALNYWRKILGMLDKLASTRGMIVGMICHSRIVTINDPENEAYDCYKMKLHEPKSNNSGALSLINEWADIIGFATKKVYAKKTESGDRFRGVDGNRRELRLEGSPAYLAGNRYNLPAAIDLKWSELESALNETATTNTNANSEKESDNG